MGSEMGRVHSERSRERWGWVRESASGSVSELARGLVASLLLDVLVQRADCAERARHQVLRPTPFGTHRWRLDTS
jgi:hypothetical protein